MKKKIIALSAVIAIVAIVAVGGTLAWFTDTAEVTNTITVGNVSIKLDEAKVDEYGKAIADAPRVIANSYRIIPGAVLDKDPTVTVNKGSEACLVYVYIDNQLEDYATLNISTDWVAVDTYSGLYRYEETVPAARDNAIQLTPVFTKVTIEGKGLTNEILNNLSGKQILVKAYAIQAANTEDLNTAQMAWDALTATATP
jgi:predicted ribosomally synthesized peptide with SipW-like signal peptide